MKKDINQIGLYNILPLFICKDLNDSMVNKILNSIWEYSSYEDPDTKNSYYFYIDKFGDKIAILKDRNYKNMLMGLDETNTFELLKFERPKFLCKFEEIDNAIRRINNERIEKLNKALMILQRILDPFCYDRIVKLAFFTQEWEVSKKHIIFTSELKRLIVIKYNPESIGSYDILYLNKDIYSDLLY